MEKKSWRQHGFGEWLNFLKAKWRLQLEAKLASRDATMLTEAIEAGTSFASSAPSTSLSIGGAMATFARREQTWQILQVCGHLNDIHSTIHLPGELLYSTVHFFFLEYLKFQILETKMPGQFTVFALVDGAFLRRLNLAVPRTFYVDDIEPRQTAMGRLTQKLLPRMRPSAYLYEFTIDEALFAARMTDFNMQMCLMRINGIYETNMPLLFKAITQTGIFCHVGTRNPTDLSLEKITRVHDNSSCAIHFHSFHIYLVGTSFGQCFTLKLQQFLPQL